MPGHLEGMARALRIEYPGALYHVMARGDGGRRVFESEDDAQAFLSLLGRACERCGWRIHAWVLMGNHFHLLLETPEPGLVAGMKWLLGVFSQGWNRRRKRRGHVFQGRYKAVPVNADENQGQYFQVVADYIHLNPVRAGLAGGRTGRALASYGWSSLPGYRKGRGPQWLETGRVLAAYELAEGGRGRRAYVRSLEERAKDRSACKTEGSEAELRRGWYLGDSGFRDRLLELAEGLVKRVQRGSVSGAAVREHGEREAERLVVGGLKVLGLPVEAGKLRCLKAGEAGKAVVARLLRERTTVGNRWIAGRLGMGHAGGVGRITSRVLALPKHRKMHEKLSKML